MAAGREHLVDRPAEAYTPASHAGAWARSTSSISGSQASSLYLWPPLHASWARSLI